MRGCSRKNKRHWAGIAERTLTRPVLHHELMLPAFATSACNTTYSGWLAHKHVLALRCSSYWAVLPLTSGNSLTLFIWRRILHAFHSYSIEAEWEVSRWERNYGKLSPQHRALVPYHPAKCDAARRGILANQRFINALASAFDEPSLVEGAYRAVQRRIKEGIRASPGDVEKVRCASLIHVSSDCCQGLTREMWDCISAIGWHVRAYLPQLLLLLLQRLFLQRQMQ